MIEFSSETGGRFTYVDDVLNLQELALAFNALFDDCDNFIVSGCEVEGNSITSGIVYINGKLRVVNGVSGITTWPQYIYEHNETEEVPYQSGGPKIGRKILGAKINATVPTTLVTFTGQTPQSIKVTEKGGLRIDEAFFGKYTILRNPSAPQTIQGDITANKINSNTSIEAKQRLGITTPAANANMYYENSKLIIESIIASDDTKYRISVAPGVGGFQFYKNSTLLAAITDSKITFHKPLSAISALVGSISVVDSNIFNSVTASDNGSININVVSADGPSEYFRDTHIGDGKGNRLLSVIGKDASITVFGAFASNTTAEEAIVLMSSKKKSEVSLKKQIVWKDAEKTLIGKFGFSDSNSQILNLENTIAGIKIQGVDFVDIAPVIKEQGVALSDKYVTKHLLTIELNKKADTINTLSIEDANKNYAALNKGLAQFVNESKSKENLCNEIGAATITSLSNCAKIENCLSDMATTEESKKKIRANIGAAAVGDFQPVIPDTSWIMITTGLYARQIGNIVCIQGTIVTPHEGTVFQLPNKIDAPRYTVAYDAPMSSNAYNYWSCEITGGTKICKVIRCNQHGVSVPISITYMT